MLISLAAVPLCKIKTWQLFSWHGLKGRIIIQIRNNMKSKIPVLIRTKSFQIHAAKFHHFRSIQIPDQGMHERRKIWKKS